MTKPWVIVIFGVLFCAAVLVASFDPFAWETEEEFTLSITCPNGSLVWRKGDIAISSVDRTEDKGVHWIALHIVPTADVWSQVSGLLGQSLGDECQLFAGRMKVDTILVDQPPPLIPEFPIVFKMPQSEYTDRLVKDFEGIRQYQ